MKPDDTLKNGAGVPPPRSWPAPSRLALFALGLGLLGPPSGAANTRPLAEVVANAELTEEGKKIPHPASDRPAYYVPVILGWQESGKIIAGEEPPKRDLVLKQLGQALAKEGYVLQALRPDSNTTLPSLIIAVEWGSLNPLVTGHGALDLGTGEGGTLSPADIRNDPTQATSSDFNQKAMVALVAGSAFRRQVVLSETGWRKIRDAVDDDRYFIIVSAYDFAASLKGRQILLWRARMSTASQGVWMNDVVPALVTAGAPLFGRQTEAPVWREFPVREGRVELGALKVIDSDAKLPAETTKDAKKK